jgi:hypothetical protein
MRCETCGEPLPRPVDDGQTGCVHLPLSADATGRTRTTYYCLPHWRAYWQRYPVATYCDGCGRNLRARYEAWLRAYTLFCPVCRADKQVVAEYVAAQLPDRVKARLLAMLLDV